jgi:hypothetical protein
MLKPDTISQINYGFQDISQQSISCSKKVLAKNSWVKVDQETTFDQPHDTVQFSNSATGTETEISASFQLFKVSSGQRKVNNDGSTTYIPGKNVTHNRLHIYDTTKDGQGNGLAVNIGSQGELIVENKGKRSGENTKLIFPNVITNADDIEEIRKNLSNLNINEIHANYGPIDIAIQAANISFSLIGGGSIDISSSSGTGEKLSITNG